MNYHLEKDLKIGEQKPVFYFKYFSKIEPYWMDCLDNKIVMVIG